MQYKLLALDIDGTLVDIHNKEYLKQFGPINHQIINKQVIDSIKSIKDKIYISLCTGRPYKDISKILKVLEIDKGYHVIESGSKVIDSKGNIEYVKSISFDDVKGILYKATNFYSWGYCEDGIWHEDLDEHKEDGDITTLSLHTKTKEDTLVTMFSIDSFKKHFHIAPATNTAYPNGSTIMITNKEANKKVGIEYIQNKLQIMKEETIAVGDMDNDLPLFEAAAVKCAVGNASDALKKEATYIAKPVYENGVADVINKFLIS